MKNATNTAAMAALMAGLLAVSAFAQSTGNTSPQATPGASPGMPMMGRGMMGQGMMGQGGMGMGMMGPMMGAHHIEGRIAFLKTEIKITAAQLQLWDAVADAMRANAKSMTGLAGGMMPMGGAASLPDRLAAREKLLSGRLDALRKYKAAAEPLYAALSDEQKKTADELMPGMMGMGMGMGMGGGMMGGGMMGQTGTR